MMNHATATVKNTVVATGTQLMTLSSQFTMQIVFVQTMSAIYLGANGLFNNLMNILSFAELGIGAAITFSLYRPLANRDMELVDALLTCYRRFYSGIGFTILLLGLLLTAGLLVLCKTGYNNSTYSVHVLLVCYWNGIELFFLICPFVVYC
ncbi:hypothetical protein K8375_10205 [Weissella cibaria]|uniref:hypothetical protein n=1 Tax=Weissella cibaria TaxID=137591 RepID=UPI001CC47536|nr:hypothetical protein [Weissella cibaria]MBZ6070419.1 hypothetical protein [Weissella cibaria]